MSERGEGERGGEIDMQSSLAQSDEEEEEEGGEKEERQRWLMIDKIREVLLALEARPRSTLILIRVGRENELKSL